MTLEVRSGRIEAPWKVLLYGTEGIGKSTFASQAEAPLFLSTEDGTAHLDVVRLPDPNNLHDIYTTLSGVVTESHEFKTLVVDTLDWLSPVIEEHVCKLEGWSNIEKPGYGKGYNVAHEEWRRFLARIEDIRKRRKMNVLFLAHAEIKRFNDPQGDSFDRYQLKIAQKSAALIKEWCDAVLFAEYETFVHEKDGRKRGISSGKRVIRTERTAAYDAKNRYGLPPTLPLDFRAFDVARTSQSWCDSALKELLATIPTDKAETVTKWIATQPNKTAAIAQAIERLKGDKAA